ncbi:endonuclease/exonuclease/phosphatase family protein [Vibrio sinaloensis]|uniref:endonuclease/exonuclease/phosphatase family protein n=1 Tax=Photobacterium sp. (strain ATCC 43367) TaxID=379097 RepID=UPI0035EE186A
MKKRWLLFFPVLLVLLGVASYQTVFTLPNQPQLSSISEGQLELSLQCYRNASASVIDDNQQVSVLVWNIYKQNRENWQSELDRLSEGKQLVLLQEASMTAELRQWIQSKQWFGSQVDAFKAFDTTAGVLNLSQPTPSLACAYTELEPWLRLPKSALYATYPLSNGQALAVVNIHAVNFTYGTTEYRRQLDVLVDQLLKHQGPIIVAGDFNSWSDARMKVMQQALNKLGLKEAQYQPDNRTQFMTGLALDHVFYRDLVVETAKAPVTDASDHNPIEMRFRLKNKDIERPN